MADCSCCEVFPSLSSWNLASSNLHPLGAVFPCDSLVKGALPWWAPFGCWDVVQALLGAAPRAPPASPARLPKAEQPLWPFSAHMQPGHVSLCSSALSVLQHWECGIFGQILELFGCFFKTPAQCNCLTVTGTAQLLIDQGM